MPKYKKKHKRLDAFRWDGLAPNRPSNPPWVKALAAQNKAVEAPEIMVVKTKKGSSKVMINDWIVRDDDGNISVVTDAEFSSGYEEDV